MRVQCDHALGVLRELRAKEAVMVGLPEVVVKIVAGLAPQFPLFFGIAKDSSIFQSIENPNIGLTFDTGKGLFIPVVKDPRTKSLKEIAETLLAFRIKAMRDAFKAEELSDGHFSISLNTDKDVVYALPIILPPQSCILSIGALQEELAFDSDHQVIPRTIVHLGLAYDHRFINGYDAVQFLKAVKNDIETLSIISA